MRAAFTRLSCSHDTVSRVALVVSMTLRATLYHLWHEKTQPWRETPHNTERLSCLATRVRQKSLSQKWRADDAVYY